MPAWADAALVLTSLPPAITASSSSLSCGIRLRAAVESSRLFCKGFPYSICYKAGFQINNYRMRTLKVKAKTESGDGYTRLAPLQFESPSGQLLVQILQSHPHLLPATVGQQLENLQSEKDEQNEEASKAPQDLLYKRIAEVKEKERRNALEEIIYCFIIYKFMENDMSMTPALSPGGGPIRDISSLPNQEDKLQSIHSPDAFEMIQNHLNLIMGEKMSAPLDTVVEISNLNLGKLYAASIMYGYFLKRVDERFQLEKTVKTLPPNPKQQIVFENLQPNPFWDMESLVQISPDGEEISLDDKESNPNKLRSYVSQLDADTLQRYATIRSNEAVSLIEKQTQALFGRPDIKVLDDGSVNAKDGKMITITFTEFTHLVLEAAAFGSFLWVAESYVESKYHFVNS
ncbi:UV-B-induced protein At3g17800, chloroplastic-like isoform X2 [Phragmites australis]|uniref:UV-B-induced protein At3g17800, chloroplastic-like isoform X2 n=1 Tax=Phragmites australis TaxID=29695 RepID=UPI002D769A4D|nr:UV-B-induced protein At3g17800, chloroplastic-like isoform X2 [Phragmites australis]